MSPAPRKPENRGLPPNLYGFKSGFRYRRPDGTVAYLGQCKAQAVQAALSANAFYAKKGDLFDKIVEGDAKSLGHFIDDYIAKKLPTFEIAEDTRKNREYRLRKIRAHEVGKIPIREVTTRDLYLFSESLPSNWTRQCYRAMLMQLFGWAIQTGLRDDNPALALERVKAVRGRERLTLEDFKVIRSHAPVWLQNFMDLQLQTAQRPGDIANLKWADVTAATIRIVQQKTRKKIELVIDPPLRQVLERCRDAVLSPYVIHRLPEKARPQHMRAKNRAHFTQVLLEQAERTFDIARVASGLYAKGSNPPTLHEIRSLAGSLYEKSGRPETEVQRLMGHSELKMTQHYLKGHEAPWEQINAGLQLPAF